MTAALIPVTALLLSVALLLMGNGLLGTLLPVRAQLETFSTLDIGILGSFYFTGFAAGCYLGPYVVRRVGHIRTFTAMVSLVSTLALAHALVLNPILWWLFRSLTGFCFAVLYMVIESWLNEKSTNEN
jgi:MFS family permease